MTGGANRREEGIVRRTRDLALRPDSPWSNPRFQGAVWVLLGSLGWLGVLLVGAALFAKHPPQAGFDLALVLDAGRRIVAGQSPYMAGAVSTGTQVESLFYSYPPPIAQAASLVAGLSNGVILVAVGAAATLGFAAVTSAEGRLRKRNRFDVVLPALALAPFVSPFAIALIFGNLDVWFPFAYGAVLLGVRGGSTRWRVGSGVALGLAVVAKLYPGMLLGWLAIRGVRDWWGPDLGDGLGRGRAKQPVVWSVLGSALISLGAIALASLAFGGLVPWQDYLAQLRASAAADFARPLNIGPASQIALLLGSPALAPSIAPAVTMVAIVLTAGAGWAVRSTLASFSVAAVASLAASPITWFHYPVAVMPLAVACWVRARGTPAAASTDILIVGAVVVSALAIAAPVAVWIAVALVLAAVARLERHVSDD